MASLEFHGADKIGATAHNTAPLLGGMPGTYAERPPAASLREHFEAVWLHTIPTDCQGQAAITPDGCADVLWAGGALRLAGPDRQVKFENARPGTTVIGFRFRPGAALAWLRTPVSEIVDGRFTLETFWGGQCAAANAWIAEAQTPDEIARRIESFLTARRPASEPLDSFSAKVLRTVRARNDTTVPVVAEWQRELGLSERTIRRRCSETFGYGPKTLDRILRFQKFLRLLQGPGARPNADLASEAGYADQPHVSREAREMAGMTVSQIRARMGGQAPAR